MKVTAANLVAAIAKLPRTNEYNYFSPRNPGRIIISRIELPEGPIYIKRYNPNKGETLRAAEEESISSPMLHRVANAIREGVPINLDRILGASYNTRSVLESLIGLTPQFHFCMPGRILIENSTTSIERGHKHLIWIPNEPHNQGVYSKKEINLTISEMPSVETIYEAVALPEAQGVNSEINPELRRIHAQIQFALVKIAGGLNCRSFVAKNDQSIKVGQKRLAEMNNVVCDLHSENMFSAYGEAANSGSLIDLIWLKNGKFMPAVIEIEHTTGVTSGLSRMKNFKDKFLELAGTRYVIAAPDEDREKVIKECSKQQFKDLHPCFLPFSNVHELYHMETKGRLRGVPVTFFDNFLENPLTN
jgi:type II restriction enzyme